MIFQFSNINKMEQIFHLDHNNSENSFRNEWFNICGADYWKLKIFQ